MLFLSTHGTSIDQEYSFYSHLYCRCPRTSLFIDKHERQSENWILPRVHAQMSGAGECMCTKLLRAGACKRMCAQIWCVRAYVHANADACERMCALMLRAGTFERISTQLRRAGAFECMCHAITES